MKEENNAVASTENSEVYTIDSAEYIIRRTKEIMKNHPHLDMHCAMDDAKGCFARDKGVFDSIKQDARLYKRIVLFGKFMFDEYRVVRKFIRDNRFFVEATSHWFEGTKEVDITVLLTESEIKEK